MFSLLLKDLNINQNLIMGIIWHAFSMVKGHLTPCISFLDYILQLQVYMQYMFYWNGIIFGSFIEVYNGSVYKEYFTPVEMVGLYWHLVDVVWIFLFPLLIFIVEVLNNGRTLYHS